MTISTLARLKLVRLPYRLAAGDHAYLYGDAGPEGGYSLLDDYRTELTGLTDGEMAALFMLSIPAPLDELGLAEDLRAALLKVAAAARARGRGEEERIRRRLGSASLRRRDDLIEQRKELAPIEDLGQRDVPVRETDHLHPAISQPLQRGASIGERCEANGVDQFVDLYPVTE